jgi:hypothetical protein
MDEYIFPNATQELLTAIQYSNNIERDIDRFLQKFGVRCAGAFMTSLTHASALFSDEELLERMKEPEP